MFHNKHPLTFFADQNVSMNLDKNDRSVVSVFEY